METGKGLPQKDLNSLFELLARTLPLYFLLYDAGGEILCDSSRYSDAGLLTFIGIGGNMTRRQRKCTPIDKVVMELFPGCGEN
ncbi:hypothetical protein GCM10010177_19540 [Actinomadura citrea]|nr:hypothetical protein GCM10010177_19540 [Actinomadura citrea]